MATKQFHKSFQLPLQLLGEEITELKQKKRSVSGLSPRTEQQWKKQLEDESDWEIYGILTGENSMDDLLFINVGKEDVVLKDSVSSIDRSSISLEC